MKVFLSWSGKVSQEVAGVLRNWLPFMLHSVRPFMSSVDIRSGDRWTRDLSQGLKDAQYGIVCVTPFNIHKPWMNFEAGSLAQLPHLTPFLFRVGRAALGDSPLAQFQLIEFASTADVNKNEFYKLIESINGAFPAGEQLSPDILETTFDRWWPEVEKALDGIQNASVGETRTAYKWLRTFDDLSVHSLQGNIQEVWFITNDVFKYALGGDVRGPAEA